MSSGLEIVYRARPDTDPDTPMNTDIHYEYRRHLHGFLPLIAKNIFKNKSYSGWATKDLKLLMRDKR
jgi:hypothetical protein